MEIFLKKSAFLNSYQQTIPFFHCQQTGGEPLEHPGWPAELTCRAMGLLGNSEPSRPRLAPQEPPCDAAVSPRSESVEQSSSAPRSCSLFECIKKCWNYLIPCSFLLLARKVPCLPAVINSTLLLVYDGENSQSLHIQIKKKSPEMAQTPPDAMVVWCCHKKTV